MTKNGQLLGETFPDVSSYVCYVRRWQRGSVSGPGHCRGETSHRRPQSRIIARGVNMWGLGLWRNNVTCNAPWQSSWQCPTRLSGGLGPTSWFPEMLTLRTLFTSPKRGKWETSALEDASWFLCSCSWLLAEAWAVPDTFFINTAARRGCWSGHWKSQVRGHKLSLLDDLFSLFIVAMIVFCSHPITNWSGLAAN